MSHWVPLKVADRILPYSLCIAHGYLIYQFLPGL